MEKVQIRAFTDTELTKEVTKNPCFCLSIQSRSIVR